MKLHLSVLFALLAATAVTAQSSQTMAPQMTAIKAGRLIDPATGTSAANQVIVVQAGKITAVGADVPIPQGAEVIDLSKLTVLPGLVDAHNHLALTYKDVPENNVYYLTYVARLHAPSRDPGRVERDPDAERRIHHCS